MTDIPRLDNCGKYLAQDNRGNWHYLNHANTWQGFQGPQIEPRHQEPVNEPADAVREAVRQYLDQQAAAHEDGHIEKGSYFSTLDNLPDFVAASLQKQESGE